MPDLDPTKHTPGVRSTELWFSRPADEWVEALPLGNGRLGMMVHGAVEREHLQVNDGTSWSGSPTSESQGDLVSAQDAADAIDRARALIAEERFSEAAEQLRRLQHRHSQAYLPFADVYVPMTLPDAAVTGYRRSLDLADATVVVRFEVGGHEVVRSTFISHPHGVAVMTVTTTDPAGFSIGVELDSPLRVLDRREADGAAELHVTMPSMVSPAIDTEGAFQQPAVWSDVAADHLEGAISVRWQHDGAAVGPVAATGVRSATIVVATSTTFRALGVDPVGDAVSAAAEASGLTAAALAAGIEEVRAQQIADHRSLFDRAELVIEQGEQDRLPIDERLARGNRHPGGPLAADPSLAALMFNLGRYLLICSSRPGGLPANLQGIWNHLMQAPWSGNYTTNINVEMNYWPSEVANLAECADPLFDLIDLLTVTGAATAERIYGAPGWVAHHNTDPWGYTQPVGWGRHDPRWAFWPLGAAWLCRHLWERIAFGGGIDFARDRAWRPVRSASEFFLHWLVELPDGTLGTSPSTSPENIFAAPDGIEGSVDLSSTMDLVLIADLFGFLEELASMLGIVGDDVVDRAAAARRRIPSPTVGRDGLVPEWLADRPQLDLHHRHVSHLYFAFPGDRELTPELAAAVSSSLDVRGDEATGWSLAWKLALRARLGQPEKISDLLRLVFRDMSVDRGELIGGLYPNLFVAHPPFQIDGNLGFVAGMIECLMQSNRDAIELLPALPPELATGSVRGIIARPGVEVSLAWSADEEGAPMLNHATFRAVTDAARTRHLVRWAGRSCEIDLTSGGKVALGVHDFVDPVVDASR